MEIKERVNDLNNMVLNGQLLDAFEKYYHSDVIMQETTVLVKKLSIVET